MRHAARSCGGTCPPHLALGPPVSAPPRRRRLELWVGLGVSVVFVYLTLRRLDLTGVWERITAVAVLPLILSQLTKALAMVAATLRSRMLLRPLGTYRFGPTLKSVLIAFVGNNVLPFRMGELLRVDYLARHAGVAHSACLAVIVFERLLDVLTLLLILLPVALLAAVEIPISRSIVVLAVGVVAAVLLVLGMSRWPRFFVSACRRVSRVLGGGPSRWISARVERFVDGLQGVSTSFGLLGVLLLSFANWACAMASIQLYLWAFGLQLPWYAPATVLIFLAFGLALPSSPAAIGTYHYFAAAGLAVFGVSPTTAVSCAIVMHAMSVGPFTLLAIPVIFRDLAGLASRLPGRPAPEVRDARGG